MVTADTRTYLDPYLHHSAQIPLRETSDTLKTLDQIVMNRVISDNNSKETLKKYWDSRVDRKVGREDEEVNKQ